MKSIQLKKSLLLGFTAISCLLLIGPSTATALTIRGCTIVNQARGGYSYTSCPGKNFTNADLTGVDLRGADLR
ncbi:MAG: pentapeptide repeat-containing protein, partial [Actinomycetes bacterium]